MEDRAGNDPDAGPTHSPARRWSAAGAFLAGAGSRLLPPSIPFRFFGGAVVFRLCAWIALFADAEAAVRFAGGLD
jgi:hypothetical protein